MSELWLTVPVVAPLSAAALLLFPLLFAQGPSEVRVSRVTLTALALSLLGALLVLGSVALEGPRHAVLASWWRAGAFQVDLSVHTDVPGAAFSVLASVWSLVAGRAATTYLHREAGYLRFQLLLCVLAAGLQLIALSGDLVLVFVGWELAGISSALLIAWRFPRADAAAAGARAFLTNRVGDAAFVLGVTTLVVGAGTTDIGELSRTPLSPLVAAPAWMLLGTAAGAKSGQLPFSPWLSRAMEGPTLSSALFYAAAMIQAGPLLLMRVAPLAANAPSVMMLAVGIGLFTAVYGWLVSLAQVDVKSAYVHAAMSQAGVTFALAGAGYLRLATLHMVGHASLRGYQVITSPSFRQQVGEVPVPAAPAWLRARPALQVAALARFWSDEAHDEMAVQPTRKLAKHLVQLDARVFDPLSALSSPRSSAAASLAAWGPIDALDPLVRRPAQRGWLATALVRMADAAYQIEQRYVLPLFTEHLPRVVGAVGARLERVEEVLAEGWAVPVLILVTLALVAGGAS